MATVWGRDLLRSPDVTDENGQVLAPRSAWKVSGGLQARDTGTAIELIGQSPGFDFKSSVRAATTAALAANTRSGNVLTASANGALAAIDGVTLVLGDSLLVKNEATGANNGIYTVTDLGSASTPWKLTRRSDTDESAEVPSGFMVVVEEGSTNADTLWVHTTNGTITINSTALTFSKLAPGAGGGSAHTIREESTPLTARTNLSFIGSYVTVTDNAGADSTDVTFTSDFGPLVTSTETATNSNPAVYEAKKSRGGGTIVNGDTIGEYRFRGHDGTQFLTPAYIKAITTGTVSTNVMPTALDFHVTNTATANRQLRLQLNKAIFGSSTSDFEIQHHDGSTNTSTVLGIHPVGEFPSLFINAAPVSWQSGTKIGFIGEAEAEPTAATTNGAFFWSGSLEFKSHQMAVASYFAYRTGTGLATAGQMRAGTAWAFNARNNANSADRAIITYASDVITVGNSNTTLALDAAGSAFTLKTQGTTRVSIQEANVSLFVNGLLWNSTNAPDLNVFGTSSGNGTTFTVRAQDTSFATGTVTGGKMFIRGGDSTGAAATHVGGDLEMRAGDATGASGTRNGGNAFIRAGSGATANGYVDLRDAGGTSKFKINSTGIGFFNIGPVARAAAYTPTNVTTDRSYDADTVAVAELADVVGTLIADLQAYGLLQ